MNHDLKFPNLKQAPNAWLIEPFLQSINQKPFLFIFSFAPYASRAQNRGPKVNAFLMQIEVWAIFVRLQVKIFENYSGIQMLSYFRNDI